MKPQDRQTGRSLPSASTHCHVRPPPPSGKKSPLWRPPPRLSDRLRHLDKSLRPGLQCIQNNGEAHRLQVSASEGQHPIVPGCSCSRKPHPLISRIRGLVTIHSSKFHTKLSEVLFEVCYELFRSKDDRTVTSLARHVRKAQCVPLRQRPPDLHVEQTRLLIPV